MWRAKWEEKRKRVEKKMTREEDLSRGIVKNWEMDEKSR
jgi:hypothetical protein